ncbi:MAG: hypothetical protein DYG89_36610 [Caldilinea sp. CFX5]|nr:hypothetical protein [Caldilinea sp. CFX5]
MTVERATFQQPTEPRPPVPPPDPTVAVLAEMQNQLKEQTHLLRAMQQELVALRTAQATHSDTLATLERQLRWARWRRRIRLTIFGIFWLAVAAVILYYWQDLSGWWNEIARYVL